jgi:SAM-dependent methyltransferase
MTFDPLAATYDDDFTYSPIARGLRGRVHARLDLHYQHGDSVLELGCGTGEDALHLAQRGVCVTATDASAEMLWVTAKKTESTGRVKTKPLDLTNPPPITPVYDGIFSNFGALNTLRVWSPLAHWLKDRIKTGGIAAFGVMSPLCLWEMAWHGCHGDFYTAFRRQREATIFQGSADAAPIHIHYPSVRQLDRAFAPYFQRTFLMSLGFFLPPSDVYGALEKRPALLHRLTELDERFGKLPLFANFSDHYWIEYTRL